MCLLFQFCDTYLEVPPINMNMYDLELKPESYNFIDFYRILYEKMISGITVCIHLMVL